MASLDGKRQWKRTCSVCEKRNWEGNRYTWGSLVFCPDCYKNRDKLTTVWKKPRIDLVLAQNYADFVEKEPFLVDRYNAWNAAMGGAFNYVKQLVEEGKVKPDEQDADRMTLLECAVRGRNVELVKYLVSKGGTLDFPYTEHMAFAVNNDDLAMFKCIYELDGNSAEKWQRRCSKFCREDILSQYGSWEDGETVAWLVDVAKCRVNGPEWGSDKAAIFYATTLPAAKALIERGADAKAKDKDGETLIFKAAWVQNLELLKYYESLGADPKALKHDGSSALYEAVNQYGNLPIVQYLVSKGCDPKVVYDDTTYLYRAVSSGDISIVQYLVEQGANIKYLNNNQENCFTYGQLTCAGDLAIDVMNYIESKGIDLKALDSSKRNYMHMVCNSNAKITTKVLDFLVSKGIPVDDKDDNGQTPLIYACTSPGSADVAIPWLISKGANIHHTEKDGQNVLHNISKKFKPKQFLKFNEVFKDVEFKNDSDGLDPIFHATESSDKDKNYIRIKKLLERVPKL